MFLKKFGGVVSVFAVGIGIAINLSFGSTAIAQTANSNLYIQVGSDINGEPIILDLASVKGSEYTLLRKHGDGTAQTTLSASCVQHRLFSKRFSFYNSAGKLIRDDKAKREIVLKRGTPESNSMEIVCQAADSRSK
ncbi:hypothetical protein NIES4103_04000 [Nostoc sp. NIES-4103]|nr:hypothetical protein NIES4103_04000 [Nostoc sp. NIES-4103]